MAEKQKPPLAAGECDSATAAKLLMCTVQWFGRLVRDGWIKKLGPNRYMIVDVVQGHIKFMKDENRRATKTQSTSRVQDARAAQIELQTLKEKRDLISIDDVCAWISETIGTLRTELSGVGAASTRDPVQREIFEKNQDAAIKRCSDTLGAGAKAMRSRKPFDVDPEEGDA